MKFIVHHKMNKGLIYFLSHNLIDRKIDYNKKIIYGFYNDVYILFKFETDEIDDSNSFHIIIREESVKRWSIDSGLKEFAPKVGFPKCIKYEYEYLLKNLDFKNKKYILFWNFGENLFVHMKNSNIERNKEIRYLRKLTEKTTFFSDNFIDDDYFKFPILDSKINKSLTNDIFMWNYLAQITWANEFSETFKHLNPPYKLGVSFRAPKPHRIDIIKQLSEINNREIFLSFSSMLFERFKGYDNPSWDFLNYDNIYSELKGVKNLSINSVGEMENTDFSDLNFTSNNETYMEFDYYFRILPKAKIQLLDETHSYSAEDSIPMNLSEKTYILLLANIPFISTHHYPFDIIKKHIIDIEYPYYDDILNIKNNTDKLVIFIQKLLNNFDEMYPKIQNYTNTVRNALLHKINSENSFLEHMTTKIKE